MATKKTTSNIDMFDLFLNKEVWSVAEPIINKYQISQDQKIPYNVIEEIKRKCENKGIDFTM